MAQFTAIEPYPPNHNESKALGVWPAEPSVFRHFKDEVLRLDLAEKWYAYRDQEYERTARDWCEANDIKLDPGPLNPGSQLRARVGITRVHRRNFYEHLKHSNRVTHKFSCAA